jgi:ATP-dependent protease ClpP protease subunit
MNNLQLDIYGLIGEWSYSKTLVKNFLAAAGKDPVTVLLSSPGGDLDHAISIYDQFAGHGNVTVILSSFNASAATLLSLSARKIIMNSNAFYLIHQALVPIDAWGNMNEDDLNLLIETLSKSKSELEKVTLVLAKMYAKKTGKATAEILTLMKEETWLTAEEALAWGFVDEICEPLVPENLLTNTKLVGMLNYAGLPVPTLRTKPSAPVRQPDLAGPFELALEDPTPGIIVTLKKFINSIFTMKQFPFLNTLLTVPSLESSDEGIYLNEAQAELINSALQNNLALVSERDAALAGRDAATLRQNEALSDVAGIQASMDAIDPSIAQAVTIEAKIEAIRTFMAAKPAVAPVGVVTTVDPLVNTLTENQKILYALPHMQED